MMELTREKAIELHRQMWSDMQTALGDCPSHEERLEFEYRWCSSHTPRCNPLCNCYLCEYVMQAHIGCDDCPIDWGTKDGCVSGKSKIDFRYSSISKILALPERKEARKGVRRRNAHED